VRLIVLQSIKAITDGVENREQQEQTQIPFGNDNQKTEKSSYIHLLTCFDAHFLFLETYLWRVVILNAGKDPCIRRTS